MSAIESLRNLINERLTVAAEEIFGAFVKTLSVYEEELIHQGRLLDVVLQPEIRLCRTELPHQLVYEEETEPADQQLNYQADVFTLDGVDTDPLQLKVEQEELCTGQEGEQLGYGLFGSDMTYENSDHGWSLDMNGDGNQSDTENDPFKDVAYSDSENVGVIESTSDHERLFNTSRRSVDIDPDYQYGKDPYKAKRKKVKGTAKSAGSKKSKLKKGQNDQRNQSCRPENKKTTSTMNSPPKLRTKPFKCDICNKECTFNSQLKRHKMIHTTGKHFICAVCGKAFRLQCYLKQHMIRHSAARPHPCKQCEKSFWRLKELQSHMRRHEK